MGEEDTQEAKNSLTATVRVFGGGRITVPEPIRDCLDLEDGDIVVAELSP